MKKVNNFVKTNILTFYVGILLVFFLLMLTACEKEPLEPYTPPTAINPEEIKGEWNVTTLQFLEEGYRVDLSAWVVYVDDSVFNIGTVVFDDTYANFNLIYGTRAEGYEAAMRWGDNHNSSLQDSSTLGWNWRAEKPLCNITDFTYLYVPATYYLGLESEEWTTTYKTTNKWVLENVRRYDNEIELTGEHYQYRELTLER